MVKRLENCKTCKLSFLPFSTSTEFLRWRSQSGRSICRNDNYTCSGAHRTYHHTVHSVHESLPYFM